MRICLSFCATVSMIALLVAPAAAIDYANFVEWAQANGYRSGGDASFRAFGDVQDSWPSGITSVIGIAYDNVEDGLWVANESGTGLVYLLDAAAPHGIIRTIDVLSFGITTDGNTDGAAVDHANGRLLLTDFNGDLNISDDVVYSVDIGTGALLDSWQMDGANNGNPNGFVDTILGICVDGAGDVWVSDNTGLIHQVDLMPGGVWSENLVQGVPTGGSWAGLDYDPCLNQFFTANFATGQVHYLDTLISPALMTTVHPGGVSTAVSSNEDGLVWVSGFGDNVVYVLEGIACGATPVVEASWGTVKGHYR